MTLLIFGWKIILLINSSLTINDYQICSNKNYNNISFQNIQKKIKDASEKKSKILAY